MPHSSTPIAIIGFAFSLGILLQEYVQADFGYLYLIGFSAVQQLALVSFYRYIQHMISLTVFLMRIKIPSHGLRNGNTFLLKASLSDLLMQHFWAWLLLACLSCCLAPPTKR